MVGTVHSTGTKSLLREVRRGQQIKLNYYGTVVSATVLRCRGGRDPRVLLKIDAPHFVELSSGRTVDPVTGEVL